MYTHITTLISMSVSRPRSLCVSAVCVSGSISVSISRYGVRPFGCMALADIHLDFMRGYKGSMVVLGLGLDSPWFHLGFTFVGRGL